MYTGRPGWLWICRTHLPVERRSKRSRDWSWLPSCREAAPSAAAAFPHAKIVPSVEDLLKEASIRLVVVATPNASHLPIARQCLLADRDVVIDKPFALSSAEAAELMQLARSRRRLLSVYQNRRWDGDFLTVRKLLDGDRLGRLVKFESHYDRFRQEPRLQAWREDGSTGRRRAFRSGSAPGGPGTGALWCSPICLGECAGGAGGGPD